MPRNSIPAGCDLLETIPEDTVFHFEKIPIPASFFSERSKEFGKPVNFRGRPLRSAHFGGLDITHVDTIVQRKRPVQVRRGVAARTPIELVGLALESVEPIEIEVGKRIERWDVYVGLSTKRRSVGEMSITRSDENGGVFDSHVIVIPIFRFIRRCDGKERVLDVGELPMPPEIEAMLIMRARQTPWRHAELTALTLEGVNDNFVAGAPTAINEESESADHSVREAPDCEVIIVAQSRALCAGAARPFTGRGSPGGGTYRWSITQGAGRAAIVSGANAQNCQVRGLNASASANDIRLQVEYEAPSGAACRASIGLTTIGATLTFSKGPGELNQLNQTRATAKASMGWPRLGAVSPGSPSECTGFRKNIEITATIVPPDTSLTNLFRFDFKRTRQAIAGSLSPGGFFLENEFHCPGGGCDDDVFNDDEDLTMSIAGTIFSRDSPGHNVGSTSTTCDAEGWRDVLCANFEEWLEVDGQQCGNTVLWHAEVQTECRGSTWVETQGSVDIGHIECLSPVRPMTPGLTMPAAVGLLDSTSPDDRTKGLGQIGSLFQSGSLNKADRQELARDLLRLATKKPQRNGFASRLAFSIFLLGAMRRAEAMPLFIDHVRTAFRFPVSGNHETAAAEAIARLGPAAVPAILDAAGRVGDEKWLTLERLLQAIQDQQLVRGAICAALDGNPGALADDRLDAYLRSGAASRGMQPRSATAADRKILPW